jgi:hypothetical protein
MILKVTWISESRTWSQRGNSIGAIDFRLDIHETQREQLGLIQRNLGNSFGSVNRDILPTSRPVPPTRLRGDFLRSH